MTDPRQRVGRLGEDLARSHLESIGYTILEANYRTRSGEVDLIAEFDGMLIFVEVRTRTGSAFGSPEESLTPRKRSHLVAVALEYLQEADVADAEWRIDLVAVELRPDGKPVRLDVIENAVEA